MGHGKRKKKTRHDIEAVLAHMRHHHPRCPAGTRDLLSKKVAGRHWEPPVDLGRAVGIVLSTHVRHVYTDYDRLMGVNGLTRDEARLVVQAEHDAILAAWSRRTKVMTLGESAASADA